MEDAATGQRPSSPIVVAGRVFVTAASGQQQRLHLLAFDADSGKLLWQRQLWATGATVCNPFGGVAGPTPVSDGRCVVAFFSSNDLACFDLDGNLLWLRGLGHEKPLTRNDVGMASSPVIVGETVIVQMEAQAASWATGIDLASGQSRWTIERPHEATWTTPSVLHLVHDGRSSGDKSRGDVVILQSKSQLSAHDPRSGREIFSRAGKCSTISSNVVLGELVYLPCEGLTALRFNPARGTLESLWQERRLMSENASPVVCDGRVYVLKSGGVLVCVDAATGKTVWQLRLRGSFWATPAVAGGRLYAVNHNGLIQVVRLGATGTLEATRQIDAGILASPAVADGAIYFRSNENLWKFARDNIP